MAKLRSENMIELVAIDLGVIITYGSCLEFAEQCYQKSLIFPCQNRKFIKWLNVELYIGIGQKKSQKLVGIEIGEYDWIKGNRSSWSHHNLCFVSRICRTVLQEKFICPCQNRKSILLFKSRPNHTFYRKFYFIEFVANVLCDNMGSKKHQFLSQKKDEVVL